MDEVDLLRRMNGQCYKGEIKDLKPNGHGEYVLSNGAVYTGQFYEGMFHGSGVITFSNGSRFESTWNLGRLAGAQYFFEDHLPFHPSDRSSGGTGNVTGSISVNSGGGASASASASASTGGAPPITTKDIYSQFASWSYCTDADRRFWSEVQGGMKLGITGQLTDTQPAPRLPFNCYDVGDGYLVVDERKVYFYHGEFHRMSSEEEIIWAQRKCRIGRDRTIQHRSSVAAAETE